MEHVILITGANNGIGLVMMTERAKNQTGKS